MFRCSDKCSTWKNETCEFLSGTTKSSESILPGRPTWIWVRSRQKTAEGFGDLVEAYITRTTVKGVLLLIDARHPGLEADQIAWNWINEKTIAIGDSLDHDIYGASKFGIKSILITSGIHKKVFNSSNLDLYTKIYNLSEFEVIPDFVCEKLTF